MKAQSQQPTPSQPSAIPADLTSPDMLMVELLKTWRQLWRMLGTLQRSRAAASRCPNCSRAPSHRPPAKAVTGLPDWDIFRNDTRHEEPDDWLGCD
jgi:hypothetical protein